MYLFQGPKALFIGSFRPFRYRLREGFLQITPMIKVLVPWMAPIDVANCPVLESACDLVAPTIIAGDLLWYARPR